MNRTQKFAILFSWLYNLTGVLSVVILFSASLHAQSKTTKPNILIIMADDLGYQDLAVCGGRDLETPHIDALFHAGIRFTNFYANSSVCSPTRASLLTGHYPDRAGVPGVIRTDSKNNWGYLNTSLKTMADYFKEAGYHTALIGKWHLGLEKPNIPTMRGFDFFKGFLGDMMDDYMTHRRHNINYMRENENEIDPAGHATDLFSDWAAAYIQSHAAANKPFLLYLAYNAPHNPVQPPADWLEKVKKRHPTMDERRAKLVALIEHLDHGVGRVIYALKETGIYNNTIIVFTSDNGGQLRDGANNGPLRDGKHTMYEGGLRVPTCIAWEHNISGNQIADYKSMTADLLPTLLDLVSIKIPTQLDGQTLKPIIKDESPGKLRPMYFICRDGGGDGGLSTQAVIEGDWKLIQNSPYGPHELYNLAEDPYESIDLIESESDKYRQLQGLMMRFIQHGGKSPWQKPD